MDRIPRPQLHCSWFSVGLVVEPAMSVVFITLVDDMSYSNEYWNFNACKKFSNALGFWWVSPGSFWTNDQREKSWTIHYAIVCLKELSVRGAREDSWAIFVCWNYALDWRLKLELGTQVNYESDVRHIALQLLAWRELLSSSICLIHLPVFELTNIHIFPPI